MGKLVLLGLLALLFTACGPNELEKKNASYTYKVTVSYSGCSTALMYVDSVNGHRVWKDGQHIDIDEKLSVFTEFNN